MRVLPLVCGGLVCVVLWGCGSKAGGADAMRAAKTKTLGVPYLEVLRGGGRETLFSQERTVIRRHGRIISWATTEEELLLRRGRRCYDRSVDVNRDDLRQLREAAWPTQATDLDVEMRAGGRVLVGRERHMDFADTEFELFLDEAGRATMARLRAAKFGVIPPGRWEELRFRYPTAAQFARLVGGRPGPRCA